MIYTVVRGPARKVGHLTTYRGIVSSMVPGSRRATYGRPYRKRSLGQLVSCDKSTLALPLSLGKSFAGMSHLFLTTPPCYLYCWRYDRVENCRIGHLHGLSCNECATQRTDSEDHEFAHRVMNKKKWLKVRTNFDARMFH